jgi:hypothetical protein
MLSKYLTMAVSKHCGVKQDLTSSVLHSRAYTHATVGFNSRHPSRRL